MCWSEGDSEHESEGLVGMLAETFDMKGLDVDRVGTAVDDLFGDELSHHGGLHHAMAGEAAGVDPARCAGHAAEEGAVVGRAVVGAGPGRRRVEWNVGEPREPVTSDPQRGL